MSDAPEILQAIADTISNTLTIEDLQVQPEMMWNPTPPAIDIYPGDPFFADIAYGQVSELNFEVRARVNTPDREGAFALILSMMDPESDQSVRSAIFADPTLGGKVENSYCGPPSELGFFTDPGGHALLGCTWQMAVMP